MVIYSSKRNPQKHIMEKNETFINDESNRKTKKKKEQKRQ